MVVMQQAQQIIKNSTYCSMVHVAQQLTGEIQPELRSMGLSPLLYQVLGRVFEVPGASPAELARISGISPQHLSEVLDRTEADGLLERRGERGRGRRTEVHLTSRGLEMLERGWPVVHGAGGDRLSEQQHLQVQALLDRLRGADDDPDDVVVLVDEDGKDAGTAPRLQVHTTETPVHRAFSCYLRDAEGRVLVTRRALHKTTWPGVWTNAACGHLRPGEDAMTAAMRRVPEELGTAPSGLRMVLPDFRYRAVDASGIVENELCPVMVGELDPDALDPDPDEVAETAWLDWQDLRRTAATAPQLLSPWCVEQLAALGEQPWDRS